MNTEPMPICRDVANTVSRRLIEAGIIVHRCDASSGSIYLRLDYGALGTIRISDHNTSQGNDYRWMCRPYIKQMGKKVKTVPIRTYPPTCRKNLVADIISEKEFRVKNYGSAAYIACIAGFKRMRKKSPDKFWKQETCHRVK